MAFSPPWLRARAAQIVFLFVVFQIPLFRGRCRTGTCESPLEVMAGQLAAGLPVPPDVLRTILYPGALLKTMGKTSSTPLPNWDTLLEVYRIDKIIEANGTDVTPYRLEVMVGSYFVVGGSIQALFKAGRLGLLGLMLIGWGLYKEGLWQPIDNKDSNKDISTQPQLYPIFFVVLVLTILTMKLDLGTRSNKKSVPKAPTGLRIPKKKVS